MIRPAHAWLPAATWLLLAVASALAGAAVVGGLSAHLSAEPGFRSPPATWFDNDVALALLPVRVVVIHVPGRLAIMVALIATVCAVAYAGSRVVSALRGPLCRTLPAFLAAQLCVGLALAASPVAISSDAYAYVLFGRLSGLHGVNPYASAHAFVQTAGDAQTAMLARLFGNPLPWPDEYGPLFTLWEGVLARIFGASLATQYEAQRVGAIVAAVAASAGLFAILRAHPDVLRRVGRFAFHPLVLLETAINGHNDMLMVAFAVGAFAVVDEFPVLAGILIGAAIGIKVVAFVLLPFLVAAAARRGRMRAVGAVVGAAALLFVCFQPFWIGLRTIGGLAKGYQYFFSPTYLVSTGFFGPGFQERLAAPALPALHAVPILRNAPWPQLINFAFLGAFVVVASLRFAAFYRRRRVENIWLVMFAFVWAAPIFNPWYFVWVAPLAAWSGFWPRCARATMLVALLYYPLFYGFANGDLASPLGVIVTLAVFAAPALSAWRIDGRPALQRFRSRAERVVTPTVR